MTNVGVHLFRLYIVGSTPAGQRAVANFEKIRKDYFEDRAMLEVVDILLEPDKAEEDHILAVPALVRLAPQPRFKIIGDMADMPRLRALLGFD